MRALIKAQNDKDRAGPQRVMTQVPRPAATLIPASPRRRRHRSPHDPARKSAAFLGGAYVFPGGALDAADSDLKRRILGTLPPEPPAEYYIAAVRECFEEAGRRAALRQEWGANLVRARALLMNRRQQPFLEILEKEDLYIPAGELVYYANWITAPGRSRRFDARFFVAVAPDGQEGSHDAAETCAPPLDQPARGARARRARRDRARLRDAAHAQRFADFSRPGNRFAAGASAPSRRDQPRLLGAGQGGAKLFRRADPQYFEIQLERSRGKRPEQLRPGAGAAEAARPPGHAPHARRTPA